MHGAVLAALTDALVDERPSPVVLAAAQAIAEAVAAHAASFGATEEPPYHDQRHQAEATIAMGWLCDTARLQGLLTHEATIAGVLAMAGHDLLHDGSVPPAGLLEARSADVTVALGRKAGLDPATLAEIRRVILATDPARGQADKEADDLLCRLAQAADLFGSLTPDLGWQLSQNLEREVRAAKRPPDPPFDSFRGRLRLLRPQRQVTPAGRRLGLGDAVADQIAAMAMLGDGDADLGAARLDALPGARARTDYRAALAAAVTE